jgi:tetratricopeptide (TPR) repeat protein
LDSPDGPADLEQRLAAAQQRLRDGDIAAAERDAAAILAEAPDNADAGALHAACAAARLEWPVALARWEACRARFPAQPTRWRVGLATALLQTGQLDAAEAAFTAALADQPDSIAALGGRALVVSRLRPKQAEGLWRDVFRRAPGGKPPGWHVARARALADSGDAGQAYTLLRIALDETPGFRPAHNLLVRLLMETGRHADAVHDLADGVLRAGGAAVAAERVRLQNWLGDIAGARASFAVALEEARTPRALTALFEAVPQSFEVYQRGETWRVLRARRDALADDTADGHCLRLRLDLALRDYGAFLDHFDSAVNLPRPWAARFSRVANVLRAAAFPDFAAPRIFGIGLSKTATSSLGRALEMLGFSHAHFLNPFSNEILGEDDFCLFEAATDTPVSCRFETLYHRFPNARFILTERPFDDWQASFERHLHRRYGTSDFGELHRLATQRDNARFGADFANVQAALYYNFPDARAAWDAYGARVHQFFADKPADKLLRHSVFGQQGWPELCAFLGRQVPAEPYPFSNRAGG